MDACVAAILTTQIQELKYFVITAGTNGQRTRKESPMQHS